LLLAVVIILAVFIMLLVLLLLLLGLLVHFLIINELVFNYIVLKVLERDIIVGEKDVHRLLLLFDPLHHPRLLPVEFSLNLLILFHILKLIVAECLTYRNC
jgi:hypothetical protein